MELTDARRENIYNELRIATAAILATIQKLRLLQRIDHEESEYMVRQMMALAYLMNDALGTGAAMSLEDSVEWIMSTQKLFLDGSKISSKPK